MLQAMKAFGGGRVYNIFSTVAHHPKLLKHWMVFGTHVLNKSTLPARERELVILRVGWLCNSPYEWGQHVVIARREGISDEEIAAIAEGPDAPGWSEHDAAILRAADELHERSTITDATWATLGQRYDTEQCMDLLFAIGNYHVVSFDHQRLGTNSGRITVT